MEVKYGINHKRTSIKNPQANAILEHIHAVFTNMLRTAKLDMAVLVNASDIDICHRLNLHRTVQEYFLRA
jgi:hypothetical protein